MFMSNSQNDLDLLIAKYPGGALSRDPKSGAWVYYVK